MKKNGIKVESVSFSFGKKAILNNVSLEVFPGKILGIVGPNGSGKTSLLKIIAGILKPDKGFVQVDGENINKIKRSDRAKLISYLPQFEENHPFTVLETVMMSRYLYMGRFQIQDDSEKDIAIKAMSRVGIENLSNVNIYSLSGGERQRVMLARMLAQSSKYLLMDEPVTGLDIKYQIQIASLIREQSKVMNTGNIMIMHNLNLASKLCDEILMIFKGKNYTYGIPGDVFTKENILKVFSVDSTITQNFHTTNVDIKFVS
ncbi:MAG: iron ABC transporter ATP-binding protein [Chloroflexi bacterium]|nr:iron ABC transporter ATP-binding protein [Chloroflexota bacterium]|tara:strand:- start:435 stop:1214 length:780 start_codon:yes stop_codon:yes gene_type:complete